MLPERAGVRVALGTTRDLTYVGFLQRGIKSPDDTIYIFATLYYIYLKILVTSYFEDFILHQSQSADLF